MKKYLIIFLTVFSFTVAAYQAGAKDNPDDELRLIPVFQYDYLSLDAQNLISMGGGFVIQNSDVTFTGIYMRHSFSDKVLHDYPDIFHTIDTLLDGKAGRHRYIGIFKSESDNPVAGGISTYQAGALYGYELIGGGNLSFVIGCGIAVGDFGIETHDGDTWPVLPVPLIRLFYNSEWIDMKFECITSPNLSFTIAPGRRLRFTWDSRMDQTRDIRDLIFECSIDYRFFDRDNGLGDFAGISAGFKNDNYGAYILGDRDGKESIEVHYYSVFGALDLSLLKIYGGYAFKGRELYREKEKNIIGNGYFFTVRALYQF